MLTPDADKVNEGPTIKRSLVLAGGGVRLAYHAGVLMALEEEGLDFNHIDGTSGGIFGTAMLASSITPKEAAIRWRHLDLKGFMSAMPLKDYRSQRTLPAMGSANGIRKKIFPSLGIDVKKINANTAFNATFNVCNFSKKTIEAIPHQQVTEDHLIAGMSLPIFMPAIKINQDWYTDAVWIKDTNLIEAINRGAEEIWLIWCIGNTANYLNGFFNQYVHMIEISANGGLFAEIERLKKVNTEREEKGLKPITLHIIKPEYPLPLDPDFFFGRINADTLINMGYADTKSYLQYKKPFDLNRDIHEATSMKNPGTTVHFRQQFEGKATIGNQIHTLAIKLSIYLREVENNVILQQFSSISVGKSEFISGYRNTLNSGGKGILQSSFEFNFNNVQCSAQLEIRFNGMVDLLLGLDGKTAKVIISEKEQQGTEAVFIQPAVSRIKNALHLNITAETNWFEKMKSKRRILKTLFR